jgi:hypothetical protein
MTPNQFLRKSFFVTCFFLSLSAGVFARNPISDKMLTAFKQTFPDAQQVRWAEQEDKYIVNFRQGEILTKIEYDKEGEFVSSLRYYKEKNLPVSILCRLQKKYSDKKIFGVTEMTTEGSVEYYVKVEDAGNWYTIHSNSDGNMQIVEKYKKAE